MKIVAVLLGLGLVVFCLGALYQPAPFDPRPGCEAEFGVGTDGAQYCELRLLTEHAQQNQDERMDRVRRK